MTSEYTAKQIKTLDDIEAVRTRVGMYLGDNDVGGLHHALLEIISNAVDEALSGFGKEIIITINKDGSASVRDYGRGIPIDKMENGVPAVEEILMNLHSGGKFGQGAYSKSGGLHGVGITAVNAVSESMRVVVYKSKKIFVVETARGVIIKHLTEVNPFITGDDSDGTFIWFKPDPQVFLSVAWDENRIRNMVRELSFLTSGIKFVFQPAEGQSEIYFAKNGLAEYIDFLTSEKVAITPIIYFTDSKDNVDVEIAIKYTKDYSEKQKLFTNNIPNEAGTHQTGFRTGFTNLMNKLGKVKFTGEQLREGMNVIISVKVDNPMFQGQTKEKLNNPEVRGIVQTLTSHNLELYFKSNPDVLKTILDKAEKAQKAEEAAQKAKDSVRNIATASARITRTVELPENLNDCSNKSGVRELFICEGQSAGGSILNGRDATFQAFFAVRGKSKNTEDIDVEDILKNKELKNLILSLGCGIDSAFNLHKVRYNKIILATDGDVDGNHIALLLLTFFFRHMPEIITNGLLYRAVSPRYHIYKNSKHYYLKDDAALEEFLKTHANCDIQYLKGLGEMSAESMWDSILDPKSRQLVQYSITDAIAASNTFDRLMGKLNADKRKEFLVKNAFKAQVDL